MKKTQYFLVYFNNKRPLRKGLLVKFASDRLNLDTVIICSDMRAGERMVAGLDDLGGEGVLDILFDQAAQVSRAVLNREGFVGEVIHERIVPAQADTAYGNRILELTEQDTADLAEVLLGELIEGDDLVDTV